LLRTQHTKYSCSGSGGNLEPKKPINTRDDTRGVTQSMLGRKKVGKTCLYENAVEGTTLRRASSAKRHCLSREGNWDTRSGRKKKKDKGERWRSRCARRLQGEGLSERSKHGGTLPRETLSSKDSKHWPAAASDE